MNRNLHVIAPADTYTAGGIVEEISLACVNDINKTLPVKVSTVFLHITSTDPLVFEELTELGLLVFGINLDASIVIVVSKIYNPCTEESIYVAEYRNDIIPFIGCCSAIEQGPIDEAPPPDPDDPGPGNIPGIENQIAFYVVNDEDNSTSLNGNLQLSANQTITINFGDGFTSVLSGSNNYNFAHVYNDPAVYPIAINFVDGSKLTKLKIQNANVSGMSGLNTFINLVEFEISNSRLIALPVLSAGLLKLNFNSNNVDMMPMLPTSLNELQCANNLLTSVTPPNVPNTVAKLICSGNTGLISFASLPTSLVYLDSSNCGLTTLPALPAGLVEMYISGNVIDDIPALPANILNLDVSDNSLDVAEVDSILAEIVSQTVDNGTLDIQDQTPIANLDAPGLADKATLQGRGWIVNND